MLYLRLSLVFLASLLSPGLGFALLGRYKKFFIFLTLGFVFTLPSFVLLRLAAQRWPAVLAPGIGVALLLSFSVTLLGLYAPMRECIRERGHLQVLRWPTALFVFICAVLSVSASGWIQQYTYQNLFESVSKSGTHLAPRLQAGDRILVTRPWQAPRTGQIVLVRNPEKIDQRLFMVVAATAGEQFVTPAREYSVPLQQVLLTDGAGKYFGPHPTSIIEGEAHQVWWSSTPDTGPRWQRLGLQP